MALNNDMTMIAPFDYARKGVTRQEQVGGEMGIGNGGNTFLAFNFVVVASGILAALATGAVLSCGLVYDNSTTVTKVDPPNHFFGPNHFPLTLEGQRFAVSVTDSSGHVGQANSAPQLSAISLGAKYGLIKLSNGVHALNVSDTSTVFFQVVEIPSKWNGVLQDATTYNPVVIVEIISACIQKI